MSSEEHSSKKYVKIWGLLLVLLVISIAGPELGIRSVTLITAFGIAVVKAVIVAREFMHIKIERKYVSYMMLSMLLMAFLFYAGTVVDVQEPSGQNWVKTYVEPTVEPPGHGDAANATEHAEPTAENTEIEGHSNTPDATAAPAEGH